MSSDIFRGVFSFFATSAKAKAGKARTPRDGRYPPNCHDTTRVFSLAGCYTHYNYCHLVVCCMLKAVGKNELVSLTGGGA